MLVRSTSALVWRQSDDGQTVLPIYKESHSLKYSLVTILGLDPVVPTLPVRRTDMLQVILDLVTSNPGQKPIYPNYSWLSLGRFAQCPPQHQCYTSHTCHLTWLLWNCCTTAVPFRVLVLAHKSHQLGTPMHNWTDTLCWCESMWLTLWAMAISHCMLYTILLGLMPSHGLTGSFCHLICCHSTDRLLICWNSTDRLWWEVKPLTHQLELVGEWFYLSSKLTDRSLWDDTSWWVSDFTSHQTSTDACHLMDLQAPICRLWMLPLPTDFECCHSQQILDAANTDRLCMLPLPTDFTSSCAFPGTLPALSYHVLPHYRHAYPLTLLWDQQHHLDQCLRPNWLAYLALITPGMQTLPRKLHTPGLLLEL